MFPKVIAITIALYLINGVRSDDILGCFGFVKSDVNIDFTKIEVKLHTTDGMLKHQSELAPNNGYYMIPFVEKGSFILKIDPPAGWVFEPMSVKLEVDGVTDACSKSQDINFHFKGFTLSGKVINQYSPTPGPQGVMLRLSSSHGVSTTVSTNGGYFDFKGVKPGDYEIRATHDSFMFHKANLQVTVSDGNAICKEDIVVSGYDVHGLVTSQSLAVEGVHFLLFSQTERTDTMKGCDASRPDGAEEVSSSSHPHFICSTTSSADGSYVFATLPSASYIVMPYHRGERIQFDVEPRQLEFVVTNDRIKNQRFEVVGFSVKGKIVNAAGGSPVVGARVIVDGEELGLTDSKGFYNLKNMNNGVYQVNVEKKSFKFLPKKLAVNTDTPQLPDIIPDQFAVCGEVSVEEKPRHYDPREISMSIKSAAGSNKQETTNLDSASKFCFYVSPGSYVIEPTLTSSLMKKGLAIQPNGVEVQVSDQPISNVRFNQYRATVQIQVDCIKSCDGVLLKLGNNKITLSGDEEVVEFNNILPGKHEVRVSHSNWCWNEEKKEVVISHQPAEHSVTFQQSGFLLVCSITHDTTVDIELNGTVIDTIDMKKRESKLCLSRVGRYNLVPRSCHKFDVTNTNTLVYDTDSPKHVTLHALAHEARFQLETAHHEAAPSEIPVQIETAKGKTTQSVFTRLDDSSTDSKLVYELVYWVKSDEESLVVTPQPGHLLFEPASATVTTSSDDCYKVLKVFRGIMGKYVRGRITPALSDVAVTISNKDGRMTPITVRTEKDGTYSHGPLHPDNQYSISAAFKDHSLMPIAGEPGSFVAKKLSKIIFQVKMGETEDDILPLGGVLLAISGGNFRSRNLTGNDGKLVISKLEPGQYYFKAAMKEYKFSPSSQVVEIEEGKEKVINIMGKRTAFSCYGNVTSLNNEPEPNVHVRASSMVSEGCDGLIEEATTGGDGKYLIKGLVPGCVYDIAVHDTEAKFTHLVPSKLSKTIEHEDMSDLKFIAFRPLNNFHLTGYVLTEREYLPFIKIALYGAEDQTNPIYVVKMTNESPFFHFPRINKDGHEYVVRLESTLSTSNYEFSPPTAGFFATGPQKHVTFQFYPTVKKSNTENTQVSVASLPLTVVLIFLFFNCSEVVGFFQSGINFVKSQRRQPEATHPTKVARKNRK